MSNLKIGKREFVSFPKTIGKHGMASEIGESFYEKSLKKEGINLVSKEVISFSGEAYNTKEFVLGLDTLNSYIGIQMYDLVNSGVENDDYNSVCEALINNMDDSTYKECLSNMESLKEMVDELYEQIKNK